MDSLSKTITQEMQPPDADPTAVSTSYSMMGMCMPFRKRVGWMLVGAALGAAAITQLDRSPDAPHEDKHTVRAADIVPPTSDADNEKLYEELDQLHHSFESQYQPMIEGFKKNLAPATREDIEQYDAWLDACDRLLGASASAQARVSRAISFYKLGHERRELEISRQRVQSFLDDVDYRNKRSGAIPGVRVPEDVAKDE